MNASQNNLPKQLKMTSSGFTLIELMVTIAVLAIIVGIAAPSISSQLANQRVKSTTATLANALKEARVESAVRRQVIQVTHNDSAHIIMIKVVDGNNQDEIASYQYNAKSKINGANSIEFKPNKTTDNKTYIVCDSNTVATPRTIHITKLGNVDIQLGGSC